MALVALVMFGKPSDSQVPTDKMQMEYLISLSLQQLMELRTVSS